jgi:methylase of polypeptide subunit release factors
MLHFEPFGRALHNSRLGATTAEDRMVLQESRAPHAESLDPMPLRIGTSAEFTCVLDFLHKVRFDEGVVTEALKIPTISQLRDTDFANIDVAATPPDLFTVIGLLIGGDAVASDQLRAACGDKVFAALMALDLVRDANGQEGAVFCPVWLYPVNGFLMASDRQTKPKGDTDLPLNDVVFPAHDAGTSRLLRLMPVTGGESLDLCGGSGICALQLARNGMRAVTTDITDRAAHFAAFNARLNGLEIESLCGDLYSPVEDRRFDLICAHPPWLPSTGDGMIFRDGGETGEAILQRIIAGIPDHLSPGGTAVLLSLGRDGSDASFQQRVRAWLGEAGRDCDVIVGVDCVVSIDNLIGSMRRLQLREDSEKADRLAARFRELDTKQFLHAAVFVRRTGSPVPEPPLRLQMSAEATATDFERIFSWRAFRRSVGFANWLAAAAPYPTANLELNIRHVVRDGALMAASAVLSAKQALSAAVRTDVWAANMVMQFDGRQTVAQVFDATRRADRMPSDFTMAAFVVSISQLVERGILEVDTPQ